MRHAAGVGAPASGVQAGRLQEAGLSRSWDGAARSGRASRTLAWSLNKQRRTSRGRRVAAAKLDFKAAARRWRCGVQIGRLQDRPAKNGSCGGVHLRSEAGMSRVDGGAGAAKVSNVA